MPDFQRHAICRAPAVEVFKILHDPARFPDWWEGTDRVEGEGEEVTRYTSEWPDFAYPTAVTRSGDGAVTISCLKFDVIQEWRLEPHPDGCAVSVRVELPERDAEPHRRAARRDRRLAGPARGAGGAGGRRGRLTIGRRALSRRRGPCSGPRRPRSARGG